MKTALKIMALFALGLCAGATFGQSVPISGQVIDQYGQPLPFAQVRVCSVTSTGTPCTPTVPIFFDYGLTEASPNPAQADQYGNYLVYAGALPAPNLYEIQLVPATGITWSYVVNGPFCSLAGCTISGPVTATIFNATTSPYYEINGTQISSAALSDAANLAYLNAANIFTGSPQTAPIFNATAQFNVNGVQIASANLSDAANLAKLSVSNVFTGTTQTAPVIDATTGYKVNGAAGTSGQALCSNGTYFNEACTFYSPSNPPTPFAGVGIVFATSTTASTVATSAQIVTALNTSPSSTLSTALLPTVGTPGAYASPTSVTTDQWGRVTAITAASGTAVDYYFSFTGCTVPTGAAANCAATADWETSTTPTYPAFADAIYTVECSVDAGSSGPSNTSFSISELGIGVGGFGYSIGNTVTALSATLTPTVYCHVHHL